MLPEVSIQNTTSDSSIPVGAPPPSEASTAAGVIRYVVSSSVGISSCTISSSVDLPQNSQFHNYRRRRGGFKEMRTLSL